ncbi:MAG: HemK2/MTQ2 family protein methyltransferase [Candidatus Woesearchaeota archaeon]
MIYEPNEDSYLLTEYVKKFAKGKVLDLGTGTGIQAETALKNTKNVLAADINKEAVEFCRKKGINTIQSDLFENIKEKFDLIIFNPPYLPQEREYAGIKMTSKDFNYANDISIVGGKKGHETIERFLNQAKNHLNKNGQILLSFSSLSGNIEKCMKKYNYKFKKIAEKKVFFETLYVYLLE